jgi:hypothetical protein
VEYKPRHQNVAADALSRRDEDTSALSTCALSRPDLDLFNEFRAETDTLPDIIAKHQEIAQGLAGANWTTAADFVLHRGRIFVPDTLALWPQILATAHGVGHEGVQKTLHHLRASFYSPHASRLVRNFMKGCFVCQRNKTEHHHPAGLLQPLDVPHAV